MFSEVLFLQQTPGFTVVCLKVRLPDDTCLPCPDPSVLPRLRLELLILIISRSIIDFSLNSTSVS